VSRPQLCTEVSVKYIKVLKIIGLLWFKPIPPFSLKGKGEGAKSSNANFTDSAGDFIPNHQKTSPRHQKLYKTQPMLVMLRIPVNV
jgi:hypothetical protein